MKPSKLGIWANAPDDATQLCNAVFVKYDMFKRQLAWVDNEWLVFRPVIEYSLLTQRPTYIEDNVK